MDRNQDTRRRLRSCQCDLTVPNECDQLVQCASSISSVRQAAAIDALLKQFQPLAHQCARTTLRRKLGHASPPQLEELVQEIQVAWLVDLPKFPEQNLLTLCFWLLRTASNRAAWYIRRNWQRTPADLDKTTLPDHTLDQSTRLNLQEIIADLPQQKRTVFERHYLHNEPVPEIARDFDISLATAYRWMAEVEHALVDGLR